MKTGWVLVNHNWYYLDLSGAMQTGWLFLDNTWYWLEPSGLMATGFKLVNGALYHFSQSGSMSTGWFVDDGTWYCANATGAIRAGWFYYGSNWYWLDPNNNGAMLLGFQTVNGSIYYLDPDSGGALECNAWIFSQDGSAYYACGSGAIVLTGVKDSVGAIKLNDAEGKPMGRLVLVFRCSDVVLHRFRRGAAARLAINWREVVSPRQRIWRYEYRLVPRC